MYNYTLDRLAKQKEDIEALMNNMSIPQTPPKDLVEWRILNENEEVDNLYVPNKTLFINDKNMVLKGVDGSLEKWEIKKVYPIDKKDKKINELEEEIKKLKEMIGSEHAEPNKPTRSSNKSTSDDDVNVES